MKKFRIGTLLVALMICLGMAPAVMAQARSLEILEMKQTEKRIESKVEPSDSAAVGHVYEAGDYLLIVEGGNAAWHAVAYQGEVYYVKKSNAVEVKAPVTEVEVEEEGKTVTKEVVMDEKFQEDLKEEMEIEEHESKVFVEEYERYKEESKQKKIWGAIIVVLVAAVFGVSIYSRISGNKEADAVDTKKKGQSKKNNIERKSLRIFYTKLRDKEPKEILCQISTFKYLHLNILEI